MRVAFVGMESPFHGHHADPLQDAADQLPGVPDRC